ncbi:MAG: VOC family protein [Spirochaetaceae bacterium]|nr:MAG: VOC family protein [Spirochaetaceae bacterium]
MRSLLKLQKRFLFTCAFQYYLVIFTRILIFKKEKPMLVQSKIHPVLSVTDLQRAKKFYGETLGLKSNGDLAEGHAVYEAGEGSFLVIYQRSDPPKAENTVASFGVDDVEGTVQWLKDRGVVFEEYDNPGLKTVKGIATIGDLKGAWFKDPDGNILAVSSA